MVSNALNRRFEPRNTLKTRKIAGPNPGRQASGTPALSVSSTEAQQRLNRGSTRVQSRISVARNEVQFREGRAFPQCSGSAGASPSQVNNHPRLHPSTRRHAAIQLTALPLRFLSCLSWSKKPPPTLLRNPFRLRCVVNDSRCCHLKSSDFVKNGSHT